MASIFLSYSREDATKADRIAHALEAAGHSVWWDRQIGAGSRFSKEIDAALKSADLVIVLWSRASVDSAWVTDEAADGRDSGRLVPVLIDRIAPPLGFRQFQAVELETGLRGRKAVEPLLDAIARRTREQQAPPPRAVDRVGWRALPRRWAIAAAAVALVAVAAIGLFILRPGIANAEPASLAVLPFKNMAAGDPYFAEGVAEEIMNQLAREPQFKVAGRTSSALFKDAADLRDVGRRLHVAYVLEGSVRSVGKQVRVDVSLVDARQGMRMWSQSFHGSLDDIFAIQESVGQQVAAQLKRRLVRAAAVRGATTTRGDVYSLAVTARSLIRTRRPAKLETAMELLERAVKLDPKYAPAWARLAQATRMSRFYGQEDNNVRREELGYAQRALLLAPDLAEGHAILGFLLAMSDNSTDAMKRRGWAEIERAVELDPTDAQNWYWLFILRQDQELDFEGALAAVRKAAEIDPFFVFNHYYGTLAWQLGEREEALRFLRNWIENHPDPARRVDGMAWRAAIQHDWSGLYQYLKKHRDLASPDRRGNAESGMGHMLVRMGLIEEARRYLDPDFIAMRLGNPPPPSAIAEIDPSVFWSGAIARVAGRALLNRGRAAEVVSLYDRAFPDRDSMMTKLNKLLFVEQAPIAAAGLRDVGRAEEATRLLTAADRLCSQAMARGRTPFGFQVSCSRSWAMLGRSDQSLRTIERAMKLGWRPEEGWGFALVDEPVYRDIRDEPRLMRLGQFILAEHARERRELLAAGV